MLTDNQLIQILGSKHKAYTHQNFTSSTFLKWIKESDNTPPPFINTRKNKSSFRPSRNYAGLLNKYFWSLFDASLKRRDSVVVPNVGKVTVVETETVVARTGQTEFRVETPFDSTDCYHIKYTLLGVNSLDRQKLSLTLPIRFYQTALPRVSAMNLPKHTFKYESGIRKRAIEKMQKILHMHKVHTPHKNH